VTDVSALVDALQHNVAAHGSAAVAFSAGVDSTLVLKIAVDVLGDRALAVTGESASVASAELRDARELAAQLGARLHLAPTHELDDPAYAANPTNRCFHCKTELYAVCRSVADAHGLAVILDGTNADDAGEWRPGLAAGDLAGVQAPLRDCGLSKDAVRQVARHLGLPNWNKPALACLASRLPYGTRVTAQRLAAVDAVEQQLRAMGFRDVRARHHGEAVHLEVDPERVAELSRRVDEPALVEIVRSAGFQQSVVTPGGYRRGRLNDILASHTASTDGTRPC
jgi:uncharacterized protein